jgi:hypothetical protein
VSLKDVERHNSYLAQTIQEEYYRVYPSLCIAVKNFVRDQVRFTRASSLLLGLEISIEGVRNKDMCSVVDPDPAGWASFCRFWIGI